MLENSKGKIWYGLHFYPGVAEYQDKDKPYRILVNENTIRAMGPTFAGRPVFVMHVEDVEKNVDELRKDADGWVVESFFNEADGKHWVKFITVTDRAERAIKNGMRLSNCYMPKGFGPGGLWNGVTYEKEVTQAEYEHLAIVPNPRYDDSVILSPEQFKKHNDDTKVELLRVANNNGKDSGMLKLFKREAVKNDLDGMLVELPKSKREMTLVDVVKELDEVEMAKGKSRVANAIDTVEVEGEKLSVSALVEELVAFRNAKKNEEMDCDKKENEEEVVEVENEDDEDKKEDKKENEEEVIEEEKEIENKKKKNDAADRLKNAGPTTDVVKVDVDLSYDKLARGKARYGS